MTLAEIAVSQFGGQGTFEADVPFQTHTRSPPLYSHMGDQGSLATLLVGTIIMQLLVRYVQKISLEGTKSVVLRGRQGLQSHVRAVKKGLRVADHDDAGHQQQHGGNASSGIGARADGHLVEA